jgi:hypothetical protein
MHATSAVLSPDPDPDPNLDPLAQSNPDPIRIHNTDHISVPEGGFVDCGKNNCGGDI